MSEDNSCENQNEIIQKSIKRASSEEELNTATESPVTEQKPTRKRKKQPDADEPNFSNYNKKRILQHLKEHGCSTKSFEQALKSFKVSTDMALEFFNRHIADAEKFVHQECNSLSFHNIEEWLRRLKSWQMPEHCSYEPALVLNAIVNNEQQPTPEELNGIDLNAIYKFLTNALQGLPQPELDKASAMFLANEFELLINEANTDTGDTDTMELKNQMENVATKNRCLKQIQRLTFDPFCLHK